MIDIKREPISFYVDRIQQKERTVFSRWGDVEWFLSLRNLGNCEFFEILKNRGHNRSGHKFHKFLTEKLKNILFSQKKYLWGMQPKSLKEMGNIIEKFLQDNKINHQWYWSDVFHRANCKGELFPLIDCCRQLKIVYVGPKHIRKVEKKIFSGAIAKYIEVPLPDCCLEEDKIFKNLSKAIKNENPDLIGFSAAMLTNILIDKLYNETECHMLDFGSIWDIYAGVKSRSMFEKGKNWDALIKKNLGIT